MTKAEQDYLLFFYKKACEMYLEGGTDEHHWIEEWYEEEGKVVPKKFSSAD